jgi:hypothetical protein
MNRVEFGEVRGGDPIALGTRALESGALQFRETISQSEYSVIAAMTVERFGAVALASWDQEEMEWRADTFIALLGPAEWTTDGHMSGSYVPYLAEIRADWPWLSGPVIREDSRMSAGWRWTRSGSVFAVSDSGVIPA